jgi:hypothetical protein
MNIMRLVLAVLAAGFVASLTDWFFFGVLFHDKNLVHPEVWRPEIQQGNERKAILLSTLVGTFGAAVFVAVAVKLGLTSYLPALKLALAIWLIAAVPITITNYLFIKLHPSLLVSHNLGWLARLTVYALATAMIVR